MEENDQVKGYRDYYSNPVVERNVNLLHKYLENSSFYYEAEKMGLMNTRRYLDDYDFYQKRILHFLTDLREQVNQVPMEPCAYTNLFENSEEKVYIELEDDLIDQINPNIAMKNQEGESITYFYSN